MLEVTQVTKSSGSGDRAVTAVKNLTLTVPHGQFAAIVGRSGSGTSTVVTHDLSLADQADRVFRVADGRLKATSGSGPAGSADGASETTDAS